MRSAKNEAVSWHVGSGVRGAFEAGVRQYPHGACFKELAHVMVICELYQIPE